MSPALRHRVLNRAGGRCEYCHASFAHELLSAEVDRIIAEQHLGRATLKNLAAACAHGNGRKGPCIASMDWTTKAITRLFHPRSDVWDNHFRWHGPRLVGLTPVGRATVLCLRMNASSRVASRSTLMEEGEF